MLYDELASYAAVATPPHLPLVLTAAEPVCRTRGICPATATTFLSHHPDYSALRRRKTAYLLSFGHSKPTITVIDSDIPANNICSQNAYACQPPTTLILWHDA